MQDPFSNKVERVDENDRAAHWHGKKNGRRRRQDVRNGTVISTDFADAGKGGR